MINICDYVDNSYLDQNSGIPYNYYPDYYQLNIEILRNTRIIQRNVIYVIGIQKKYATVEILSSHKYFGQYGKIQNITIQQTPYFIKHDKVTYHSAYITYTTNISACLAIICIESKKVKNHERMSSSYAATRYCKSYLFNHTCKFKECTFYHTKAPNEDCILRFNELKNKTVFDLQLKECFEYAMENFKDQIFYIKNTLLIYKNTIHDANNLSVQPDVSSGVHFLMQIKESNSKYNDKFGSNSTLAMIQQNQQVQEISNDVQQIQQSVKKLNLVGRIESDLNGNRSHNTNIDISNVIKSVDGIQSNKSVDNDEIPPQNMIIQTKKNEKLKKKQNKNSENNLSNNKNSDNNLIKSQDKRRVTGNTDVTATIDEIFNSKVEEDQKDQFISGTTLIPSSEKTTLININDNDNIACEQQKPKKKNKNK